MSPPRGVAMMRVVRWAAYAVITVFFIVPANGLLHAPSTSMEETSILQYASMTADGSVPTKDFWTEYGPMNVYAPAAVFSVTGPSLLAERLLGLLYRGILLASLFVILRRYSQLAALIGVSLAWWMLAPWGAMAYAWIAGMGLAVASLALISGGTHPPSSRRLFVAAATAGLALSFRPDLIVALGVGAGIIAWPHRRQWKPLVGGGLLGLAPYLLLLGTAGLGNVMRNLVIDPLIHLRDGRALPFPPSWKWNAEFFSRVQQYVDAMTHRNWYGAPLVVQIAELFWLLVVVALVIAVATATIRRTDRVVAGVGLFALLLATNIYQRADISHMRLVGALWLALAPLAIGIAGRRWFQREPRVIFFGSAALFLALVLVAPEIMVASFYELSTKRTSLNSAPLTLRANGRSVITSSAQERDEIAAGLAMITAHSKPGERFVQGPTDFRLTNYNEPAFYWLNPDLVPATYYLEMNPGISNAPGSTMASDLAAADVLLLSNRFEQFSEPNTSTVPGDNAANKTLVRNFCFVDATKWYTLLRHTASVIATPARQSDAGAVQAGPNWFFPCSSLRS